MANPDTKTADQAASPQPAASPAPAAPAPAPAPAKQPEPKAGSRPYQVKAIAVGYFGGQIRVYGDRFEIAGDQDFATWMEAVEEVDRKRLAATVEKMQRGRKQPAPPGTRPTPATKLV